MKRLLIKKWFPSNVADNLKNYESVSLAKLKEYIDEDIETIKRMGIDPDMASITIEADDGYLTIVTTVQRTETDEEYNKRRDKANKKREQDRIAKEKRFLGMKKELEKGGYKVIKDEK